MYSVLGHFVLVNNIVETDSGTRDLKLPVRETWYSQINTCCLEPMTLSFVYCECKTNFN